MLEKDLEFFNRSLPEWLKQYPGKVALVKDENLVGVFDTDEQALTEGARLFQRQPFLVRRIQPENPAVQVPALMLGILRANPNDAIRGNSTRR